MSLNTSKKYTVRVHYLNVKSKDIDSIEEKDVELKNITKTIKAMIAAIMVGSDILDLSLTITNIEVT